MIAPHYRRPRNSLSPDEVASLVRMRNQGATWKEIGRTFGKQDGACKLIFDRAAAEGGEAPKAGRHPAAAHPAWAVKGRTRLGVQA